MTTTLDDATIARLRADLDDYSGDPVFSDDELDELYIAADGNYAQTMVFAINRLLMNAVKLEDYKKAHEELKGQDVYDRLKDMRDFWIEEEKRSNTQIAIVGMQNRPRRWRDVPYTQRWPTNLRRHRRLL